MISIWFFTGREWRADFGCGNLPVGESSSESERGALPLARQCVVGCDVAGVRSHLLFQIRTGAMALNPRRTCDKQERQSSLSSR